MRYLNNINSPEDLKKLKVEELKILSEEIREVLINKISETGGHMGSNLGVIEMTIALHYVFNSPYDKFVFDVSHQTYTHKILTGRKDCYMIPEKYKDISGYTNPKESEHDMFIIGHTSTSVSLATGMAKARDLRGGKENIVAIIGDGSLSGGQAFEGLNNASTLDSNIIIIVNDNDMSIAENFGGLYKNLSDLRETKGKSENNFFKTFGFEYVYIDDGNDVEKLIENFKKVKDINKPIVLHIKTLKGKGLEWAIKNKEAGHWAISREAIENNKINGEVENFEKLTADYLLEKIENDKNVIVINAATPGSVGLNRKFRKIADKQYTDVGIAEEHLAAYGAGLVKNGAKPVLYIRSAFSQRFFDQLSHDICLNNLPVTILVAGGCISSNEETHLNIFDMSMMTSVPNLVCLSPVTREEYFSVLEWGIEQNNFPLVIRIPTKFIADNRIKNFNPEKFNKYQIVESGEKIAIIALGNFFELAKSLSEKIKKELNIVPTLINPLIYSEIDKETLEKLLENHDIVISLEDGLLNGGMGEKISRYYSSKDIKVLSYGAEKEFTSRVALDELYNRYHLRENLILKDIKKILK